jgi:tRNA nucleotidyltransferase (CCA-adding enzyme)
MKNLPDNWKTLIPAPVMMAAKRLHEANGTPHLVGGAPIDIITGRSPKDFDIEVFGKDYSQLEALFPDYPCKRVGKAFGIIKLAIEGIEIDISIPRVDNSTGEGHSDFEAILDPRMTVKEAARRRDFTINTLAVDLLSGEIVDEWGGLKDLKDGILRATDPELFVQDPLRVLRAMQLLARKASYVETQTLVLIQKMLPLLASLPPERRHVEFQKLFLKAPLPSVGLEFAREAGILEYVPSLNRMVGCPQREEWHPEGDVWVHSCLAADAAAQIRHLIPDEYREAFMFGVFLHDVGKPDTTVTQKMIDEHHPWVAELIKMTRKSPQDLLLTAITHDRRGMDPAEEFMRYLTDKKKLIRLVRGIVGEHMKGYSMLENDAKQGAYARLHRVMKERYGGNLRLLARVCQCDACATSSDWRTRSLASGSPNWEHRTSERMLEYAEKFENDESLAEPMVLGRDLLARGMEPGPEVGKLLKKALELQYEDSTLSKEDLINYVMPRGEA